MNTELKTFKMDYIVNIRPVDAPEGTAALPTVPDSVITSTLGISLDTVVSRLKAGETLSTIAGDKKSALITALAAEINKQIETWLMSDCWSFAAGLFVLLFAYFLCFEPS